MQFAAYLAEEFGSNADEGSDLFLGQFVYQRGINSAKLLVTFPGGDTEIVKQALVAAD